MASRDAAEPSLIGTAPAARLRTWQLAAADPAFHVKLNQDALTLLRTLAGSRGAGRRPPASAVYGLNTLLGSGRDTAVEEKSLLAYQVQVIRYHNSGVGSYLDRR